jgi:NAD dependent epimerase/dehydratase family enzyme
MRPALLLTGGHGPLGAALRAALAQDGALLHLDGEGGPRWSPRPDGPPQIEGLDRPVAAVVNLWAPPVLGAPGPQLRARRQAAVERTQALAAWITARSQRPAVLVQLGSALAFTDQGGRSLNEEDAVGGDPDADLFAAHEQAAARVAAAGVRVAQLRAGLVLAPHLGLGTALARLLRMGLRPRRLGAWIPWIGLDDLADVVRAAVATPALQGPVHVVSPGQLGGPALLEAIAGHRLLPAPRRLCQRIVPGVDLAGVLGQSRRLRPSALLALGFQPQRLWPT